MQTRAAAGKNGGGQGYSPPGNRRGPPGAAWREQNMSSTEWLVSFLFVGAWLGLLYALYGLVLVLRLSGRIKALLEKMQRGLGRD